MSVARLANLAQHIKELRIHLCQTSPASKGVRDFIEKNYVDLKKTNKDFPILIRECSNVEAKVFARFNLGVEKSYSLENKSSDEVVNTITKLVNS